MPDERIETKAANVAPLLFTPEQAAKVLACGRTTIFVAIADGRIRATKLGRSTRIHRSELERVATVGL